MSACKTTGTGNPPLTRFSNNTVFKISQFILVLSFVHLALNHSSACMVFCLLFFKSLKNRVSRGPPVYVVRPQIHSQNSSTANSKLVRFLKESNLHAQHKYYCLFVHKRKVVLVETALVDTE